MKNFNHIPEGDDRCEDGLPDSLRGVRMKGPSPGLRERVLRNARQVVGHYDEDDTIMELPEELRLIEDELACFQLRALSAQVKSAVLEHTMGPSVPVIEHQNSSLKVWCWGALSGLAASLALLAVSLSSDPVPNQMLPLISAQATPEDFEFLADDVPEVSVLIERQMRLHAAVAASKPPFFLNSQPELIQ